MIPTDEYVAFLMRLSASPQYRVVARATLLKSFNPTEERDPTGKWTAGGNTDTISETPQRRQRRQQIRAAKDRAESGIQLSDVERRLGAVKDPKAAKNNARNQARKKYGIPSGKRFGQLSPGRQKAAQQILDGAAAIARIQSHLVRIETRIQALGGELSRPNLTTHNRDLLQRRLDHQNSLVGSLNEQMSAARSELAAGQRGWK
jgi:hypothetical protein